MANCSSDMSYMNDEFVELLWDNGSVVMQGQSTKPRKSSFHTVFAPCGSRVQEKDSKDNPFPKIGHFREIEAKSNNLPLSGPSSGIGITAQDDNDIVPWINYPIDESLHNDYFPEFLNDYTGVSTNMNAIHSQNNTMPAIRSSISDEAVRNSPNMEQQHASETTRIRPQLNGATPTTKSSELNFGCKGQENGLMNFSHFSRPVALARANLQDFDRLKSDKATVVTSNNPTQSFAVGSTSGLKSDIGIRDQPKKLIMDEQSKVKGDICEKKGNDNTINSHSRSSEKIQSSSFESSVALQMHETDKCNETAVASSSMCTGSSAGTTSTDHTKEWGGREHHEGEEFGHLTEDRKFEVFEDEQDREDESVDLKKHATLQGKSKKRSRAAEVHNLSERRRRDRINEKMRALQELIPNCNKTDKASMLDEAIEYLKSLQTQVQIMSIGSGLCMSPMVMQHVQAPSMAHYSPMGMRMGMGMGLGYGMGMYDMNGSPFIHVPPIQGPQFPCPLGYHRVPGSNSLQMFGSPAQGFPVPTYNRPSSTTNSEGHHHQQKRKLEKTQRSNTNTFQIQSAKRGKDCVKNSSSEVD